MNTIKDLKARMTVGKVITATEHIHAALKGERTVMKVQSNSVATTFPVGHPKYVAPADITSINSQCLWMDWPKRADVTFDGDLAIITNGGRLFLTLKVPADV